MFNKWSMLRKLIWFKGSVLGGSAEYQTVSGPIASFVTLRSAPLKELVVDINPVQDLHGYANPWPPGGGMNLLNYGDYTNNYRVTSVVDNGDGSFTVTASGLGAYVDHLIPVTAGVSYSIKCEDGINLDGNATQMNYCYVYDGDNDASTALVNSGSFKTKKTFTPTGSVILVRTKVTGGSGGGVGKCVKPMVFKGETLPEMWTPYSNICPISGWTGCKVWVQPTHDTSAQADYNIIWQTEAGTVYGSTLTINEDRSMVLLKEDTLYDLGNTNWKADPNRPGIFYGNLAQRQSGSGIIACSGYKATNVGLVQIGDNCISGDAAYGGANVFIKDTSKAQMTAAEFTEAVSGVTAVIKLASPVTYQLTAQQVIDALQGQNYVWADTGDVSVTYRSN